MATDLSSWSYSHCTSNASTGLLASRTVDLIRPEAAAHSTLDGDEVRHTEATTRFRGPAETTRLAELEAVVDRRMMRSSKLRLP
jgi:hypothetical protein